MQFKWSTRCNFKDCNQRDFSLESRTRSERAWSHKADLQVWMPGFDLSLFRFGRRLLLKVATTADCSLSEAEICL